MPDNKEIWISEAYQLVASVGFDKLSVESLARQVGKNKSSFYHYFGDLELFENVLLDYHINATKDFASEINKCQSLNPDVLILMIQMKIDLFFHKQLRINREKSSHKACFEKSYQIFQDAIFDKWIAFLGLSNQKFFGEALLNLASENFLLRITPANFTFDWLVAYVSEFAEMMRKIHKG
jgi:AcrR family transcriptional regulator